MRLRQQTGVAIIEFTIMLPILLLMIFATAELGRALYQYSHLTRIVRDAGRYLSTKAIPNTTGNIPVPFNDANCDNCISNTKALLVYGKVGGTTPLLYGLDTSDVTITGDPETKMVIIKVDYDWLPLFGEQISGFGAGNNSNLSLNFHVSYAMRAGL
ncbi:TadE/TadG family type IV pilus assembly protein [Shewanella surugensis]|uniref:Pilus assembly protein n=1 Tax=Shewanella surugensis TaxID=212020 RepID=A0ABT0LI18_9GAMM|nr:TadE/TadG family type IV pilus assembly protein [Shewanella surugensis]MCL1127310.1 pilus assembly protein [Shewanella surugensis]